MTLNPTPKGPKLVVVVVVFTLKFSDLFRLAENACAHIYTDTYAEALERWVIFATGVCLSLKKDTGVVCLWLLMFLALRSYTALA